MGYVYRYNPGFKFIFKAVKEGLLGDIVEVDGVMSKKVNDATRQQLARYPGGTMFELGCHLIDELSTLGGAMCLDNCIEKSAVFSTDCTFV